MSRQPQLAAQGMHFLLQGLIVDAATMQLLAEREDIVLSGTQLGFHAIAAMASTSRSDEQQSKAASHEAAHMPNPWRLSDQFSVFSVQFSAENWRTEN
jgi:hypothetical protein